MIEENIKELKEYSDFLKVFKVFMDEPFYEAWTEEEMLEEFKSYENNNGIIFGLYNEENIKGLITLVYKSIESHPVKFANSQDIVYLSDVATLKETRKKGVGTKLTIHALDYLRSLNKFKYIYTRTNVVGSYSIGIFKKQGFEVIRDEKGNIITQWISFPRVREDIPEQDERLFLIKKL